MVECPKCGENFSSEEAMEQHLEDYDHSKDTGETVSLQERVMTSNWAGIAIISLLILGGGFFAVNALSGSGTSSAGDTGISNADDPFLGPSNATVTIAYFGDYGCPLCNRFEQTSFPQLRKQVIEEGEAKFVKKNFPVVTRDSPRLAQASQAVWNQVKDSNPEKFWEWHAHIYDNQGRERSGWATKQRILELTGQIDGINVDKIRQALNQNKYSSEVREDLQEGRNSGVRGTPTFIIYNTETGESKKLVGPQPVSRFKSVINQVK
ncbi:MAG: thioredoxin domain-containing protein [Candidatus Nanohalobium sp.]